MKQAPDPAQTHILFVDDEKHLVEIGRMLLEQLGYRVVSATSAAEALEAFHHAPNLFRVIVLDLLMPEITGLELARRIRRVRPDIPIILCTGLEPATILPEPRDMAFHKVLMKPIVSYELIDAVRTAIR